VSRDILEEMGLPKEMSEKTIATIKATAPVVAPKALEITQAFYSKVLGKMPALLGLFNKSNFSSNKQPRALAEAVVAYASNIDSLGPLLVPHGPVDMIANKHCGLNIAPAHYVVVHENLMETIGEVLGAAVTPDIAAGWSEAVLFLAGVMIDWEERLYSTAERRPGGWRGPKKFTVTEVETITANVKRFTFKDPNYDGAYHFTPGQFLTLKVDPDGTGTTAPRHYTVTSMPGDKFLQCSIKHLPKGVVSGYMHLKITPGSVVELSPPFGVFTPIDEDETVVLISAGIGVTPMMSLGTHFGSKVQLIVHVDKSPESHPHVDHFQDWEDRQLFRYTSANGQTDPKVLAAEIKKRVGVSHGFYLCGPPLWMAGMKEALTSLNVGNVYFEAFMPQLGCPVH